MHSFLCGLNPVNLMHYNISGQITQSLLKPTLGKFEHYWSVSRGSQATAGRIGWHRRVYNGAELTIHLKNVHAHRNRISNDQMTDDRMTRMTEWPWWPKKLSPFELSRHRIKICLSYLNECHRSIRKFGTKFGRAWQFLAPSVCVTQMLSAELRCDDIRWPSSSSAA